MKTNKFVTHGDIHTRNTVLLRRVFLTLGILHPLAAIIVASMGEHQKRAMEAALPFVLNPILWSQDPHGEMSYKLQDSSEILAFIVGLHVMTSPLIMVLSAVVHRISRRKLVVLLEAETRCEPSAAPDALAWYRLFLASLTHLRWERNTIGMAILMMGWITTGTIAVSTLWMGERQVGTAIAAFLATAGSVGLGIPLVYLLMEFTYVKNLCRTAQILTETSDLQQNGVPVVARLAPAVAVPGTMLRQATTEEIEKIRKQIKRDPPDFE